MKIWLKLLIGSALGIILGFILPANSTDTQELFKTMAEIIIKIGRYLLYPLVFFSLTVGIFTLRESNKGLRVFLRTIAYMLIFSLGLTIIGTLSVLMLSSFRIPIIIERGQALPVLKLADYFRNVFSSNLFAIFADNGNFLLPVVFLALILGINMSWDKQLTRPVVQLFDSFSQIFYRINDLLAEIMGIGMIALSTWLVIQMRMVPSLELFRQLIIVLLIDVVIIVGGVFPLLIYFLVPGRRNPYKWIYAALAAGLSAFFSGDNYFSQSFLIKTGRENMGVPRRVGAFTYPMFALFGKAGTSMVTGISFIVILKSYSSLGIAADVPWVILIAFLLSFLTGNYPALGFLASIAFMCNLYGQDLQEGYLVLSPIIPLLSSFSVFLDVMTSAIGSLLIAEHEHMRKDPEIHNFA